MLGRTKDLDPHKKDVLRELNPTLHRAHIVGYDALAQQARKTFANIMDFLAAPSDYPSVDSTDLEIARADALDVESSAPDG